MANSKLENMTEEEFLKLLNEIFDVKKNRDIHDDLIAEFEQLAQHPDGSDLIFYPETPADSTPERILEIVKEWRSRQGLPGFKQQAGRLLKQKALLNTKMIYWKPLLQLQSIRQGQISFTIPTMSLILLLSGLPKS